MLTRSPRPTLQASIYRECILPGRAGFADVQMEPAASPNVHSFAIVVPTALDCRSSAIKRGRTECVDQGRSKHGGKETSNPARVVVERRARAQDCGAATHACESDLPQAQTFRRRGAPEGVCYGSFAPRPTPGFPTQVIAHGGLGCSAGILGRGSHTSDVRTQRRVMAASARLERFLRRCGVVPSCGRGHR
jgi:hypothetical protein